MTKQKIIEDYSPLLENQPPGLLHALLELRDLQIISARFESFWRKFELAIILFGILNLIHSLIALDFQYKDFFKGMFFEEKITYILLVTNFPLCLVLSLLLGLVSFIPAVFYGREGISSICGCIPIFYTVINLF